MPPRPLTVTVSAILLALLSLANLLALSLPTEGVPAFVIYLGVVLGVAGVAAAAGLWMLKRWSLWLTIIVCVLNILSSAPGIAAAPNAVLRFGALVFVIGSALIILLVVLPNSRRAYS
jgi:hypothetical protein